MIAELNAVVTGMVRARLDEPTDDLTSALLRATTANRSVRRRLSET